MNVGMHECIDLRSCMNVGMHECIDLHTRSHTHTHTYQLSATPASNLPVKSSKQVPVLRSVLQPLKISLWVVGPFVVGRRLSKLFKVMARTCSETALGTTE